MFISSSILNLLFSNRLPIDLKSSFMSEKKPPGFYLSVFCSSSGVFYSSYYLISLIFAFIAFFRRSYNPVGTIVFPCGGLETYFYDRISWHMESSYSWACLSNLYCSISIYTLTLSYLTNRLYSFSFSRHLTASNAKTKGSPLSCSTSNKNSMKSCIYESAPL